MKLHNIKLAMSAFEAVQAIKTAEARQKPKQPALPPPATSPVDRDKLATAEILNEMVGRLTQVEEVSGNLTTFIKDLSEKVGAETKSKYTFVVKRDESGKIMSIEASEV